MENKSAMEEFLKEMARAIREQHPKQHAAELHIVCENMESEEEPRMEIRGTIGDIMPLLSYLMACIGKTMMKAGVTLELAENALENAVKCAIMAVKEEAEEEDED